MTSAVTDFSQYTELRSGAARNDPAVLREVAGQFEALFLQTLLKNMRNAELAEPLFGESDQHGMYQDMMDQQLSVEMASGRGMGLADMLVRQLGGTAAAIQPTKESYSLATPVRAAARKPDWPSHVDFARDLWPHAKRAAGKLNVAPEALLAQAALETGWGKHVMQRGDGVSSFNLFGIKAGTDWPGGSVSRATLEYRDGLPQQEVARFRAYPDIAATFDDYAEFIASHPRYEAVQGKGADVDGFARALQDAGYATDPSYAEKINRVLNSEAMQNAMRGLKNDAARPITLVRAPVTEHQVMVTPGDDRE
ncbi:MAG: glucosaminidase domain-containing protein [Gammaproteobacteria bacterium]|nr:glucosaminidase domain-containing protein [Gammaproteobacteria bacterium]MDH4313246.1 glucosaminidase domain-containing protein [Gammaproteobacteria bacterium]MDH5213548.1 glucosaminidase domain-containing protein [Gammaproteobacteria bacterium]MDH5501959.1 glucosaminidase domain-containing protein [Gammaproteobacteria bacterium]